MVQVTSLTEKEFSDTNFETRKCFDWMLQSSSGWNIGKVFQSQSWYQRTLFSVYAGANWEATISKWLHGINCSLSGHSLAGGHFSPLHFMYRFDSNEHSPVSCEIGFETCNWLEYVETMENSIVVVYFSLPNGKPYKQRFHRYPGLSSIQLFYRGQSGQM